MSGPLISSPAPRSVIFPDGVSGKASTIPRTRAMLVASDLRPGLGEDRAEDLLHLVEVLLGADQRRRELNHRVAAVIGAAHQAGVEQRVRKEAAQQPLGLIVVERL